MGIFLVESQARFLPLCSQRWLELADVTERDHIATPKRWTGLSRLAERHLRRQLGEMEPDSAEDSDDSEEGTPTSPAQPLPHRSARSTPRRKSTPAALQYAEPHNPWAAPSRPCSPPDTAPPFRYILHSPSTASSATTHRTSRYSIASTHSAASSL